MLILLKILYESFDQAFHQLRANVLRSFLSLLGITIGIFCIISVMSAVDSLEDNIKGSFEQLGNDVLFISKLPWAEDPGENYWKYFQRPVPTYQDYQVLKARLTHASEVSFMSRIGRKTIKYRSNNVDGAFVISTTPEYADIFDLPIEKGRYYSVQESASGSNKVVLGHTIAEGLFGTIDPLGKDIKLMGRTLQVIGVVEKSGQALVNPLDYDNAVLLSHNLAKKMTDVRLRSNPWGTQLNVKAKSTSDVGDLRDEVTGVLRAHHRLQPRESDDFSLNEISIIADLLDNVFNVMNIAGILIGVFAILVGIFSVANIMFVSVKERTSIIGVKKALGAKRYFILLEYLIEAVVLCILGGIVGLVLVAACMKILTSVLEFDMYLSVENIGVGLLLSIAIGVLAGFIPANQAAKMDPVEAMRQ